MKELTDKSFSYRYYFQLSMLLMIIMVSCEQKEDTTKEKEVLKIDVREIDSTAVEKLDRKELYQSILSDSIIKSLDNYAITELPFSNREDFLKTQGVESIGVKDSVDIWSQKEQLGVLDHFLTLEMIEKSCNIDFELDDKDFSNVYLLLIKRFKPVNDSIELLLFSNKYDEFSNEGNESDVMFWVIASINTHKKKVVDAGFISVFNDVTNSYFNSGMYINQKYQIKTVNYKGNEGPAWITDKLIRIDHEGKFEEDVIIFPL